MGKKITKNKYLIFAVVFLVFIVLGLVLYSLLPKSGEKGSLSEEDYLKDGQGEITSLSKIIAMDKDQRCIFRRMDENVGKMQGVTYVSKEKIRTDFNIVTPDEQRIDGGMIIANERIYTWNSDMSFGAIVSIPQGEDGRFLSGIDEGTWNDRYVAPNQEIEYDCEDWKADQSRFIPPRDQQFTDLTQIDFSQEQDVDYKEEQIKMDNCQACELLDGEDVAKCKEQVNCPTN